MGFSDAFLVAENISIVKDGNGDKISCYGPTGCEL